jgi:hypothetical protein
MRLRLWLVLALTFGVRAGARADLGMTLSADATVAETITVSVAATNTGDEAAHVLVPEVRLQSTVRRGGAVTNLEVGREYTWQLVLPAPSSPGTFPLVVRLAYDDGHGRPSAAHLVRLVSTAGVMGAPVEGTLAVEPTSTHGTATLTLVNPTLLPVAGRVVPILPGGFTTEPESLPAQIPAQGRTQATFIVENGGALPGSTFPLYALFEYAQRGIHQTVLAETSLRVVPPRPGSAVPPLVIGGAALLAAVGLLGLAWRRAAR